MSVKVISKEFNPHFAAEFVVLEDGLGRRHNLTIHIQEHEACPACGRPANKKSGAIDVEKTISDAVKEMESQEKKLRGHARKRGYRL